MSHNNMTEEKDAADILSKYMDRFEPVPSFHQQGAPVQEMTNDRRNGIEVKKESFLSRVGQLRLYFGDNKLFVGTGTVFAIDQTADTFYVLTCAHNLIQYHPINGDSKVKMAWFERRKTKLQENDSESIECYSMEDYWVHPSYDSSKFASPYDLAVLCCKDLNNYFKAHMLGFNGLSPGMPETNQDVVYIYGYPSEKKGQLWGMGCAKQEINVNPKIPNLLEYDNIDTSGGQSGSPIFTSVKSTTDYWYWMVALFVAFISIGNVCGLDAGLSLDVSIVLIFITFIVSEIYLPATSAECNIIGVHTTGHVDSNYGVKLTKDSLDLIQKFIGKDGDNEGEQDKDRLYCLKDETFTTPYM